MRLNSLVCILYLSQFASAWPWPRQWQDGIKAMEVGALLRRQDTDSSSSTPTQNSNSGSPRTTGGTATPTNTDKSSITNSGQGTSTPTGTATRGGKNSTSTAIDLRDPAGGVSMITPNPTLGPQYYKIGDWVTFAWNYTSLSVTPSAVNIVASCSQNNQIYTLTGNASVAPTGTILWDTGSFQNTARVPLLTNQYTLIIYDAQKPITATPSPGYLGSYSQFTFGMYEKQPYSNWTDFRCPTCNNGAASLQRMTIHFLLGMVGVTVLSFTWFVTNLSAL